MSRLKVLIGFQKLLFVTEISGSSVRKLSEQEFKINTNGMNI
ncbi:MAG: hypothetical protein ACLU4J_14015 [Butyricimonas paravirosa]